MIDQAQPRSSGVNQADVSSAADAILMAGIRPTVERVRQQIGRGSPNTVGPLLDLWFKRLPSRISNPQGVPAPSAVPEPIQQVASQLWDAALATAQLQCSEAFRSEREAMTTERQALDETRRGLQSQKLRLDDQARDQAAFIETLQTQVLESKAALDHAQQEGARLATQNAEVTGDLEARLVTATLSARGLEQDIQAVKDAHDRDLAAALVRIDRANSDTREAVAALAAIRERCADLQAALTDTKARLNDAESTLNVQSESLKTIQHTLASALSEAGRSAADAARERALREATDQALSVERANKAELSTLLHDCQQRLADTLSAFAMRRKNARTARA